VSSSDPVQTMTEPAPQKDVGHGRHLARGTMWTMMLRWAIRLTGLVSTVLLARLLSPSDYGIVTIATLIVSTIEVFSQTGQASALVRLPNPTREHYDSAWTISLLLGIGLGLVIFAATPLTTAYFHEPRAKAVVEILAFRTALSGLQNVGVVNFQRNLQFRAQFQLNVWPTLISFFITIPCAFLLRNYWALVIGIMSKQIASVIFSYTMEPYRPRICFTKVRELWSFSTWMLFKNLGIYLNERIDELAIGRFGGAAAMGRYNVAYDLASSPCQEIVTPMVTVLFPVMAKIQNDRVKRRELYSNVLYWSALISVSTGVGVALVANDMVDLILGAKWQAVKPLMPWLALSSAILAMSVSVYSAFDLLGQPRTSARLQWVRCAVLFCCIFPVANLTRNLEAVAATRLLVTIAVTPTLFISLGRALDLSGRDFLMIFWRPFAAGLAMTAVVLGINMLLISTTGLPRLALDVASGGATYVGVLMALWFAIGRPEGPEKMLWQRVWGWIDRPRAT
jgi:lipopolysaccharide exporter